MEETRQGAGLWRGNESLIAVAALNVVLHSLAIGRYGYHRDELYFLDCARHLAFGYVDHPPFLEFVLAATRRLFGESLVAIRIPAVAASTAVVVLTGLMARRLDGGRFAELLAGLAAVFATVYLITGAMISVEGLNTLFWAVCLYVVLLILRNATPARWLWLGAFFGIGMLTKYAIAFLGAGLAVGLVLTPQRRLLSTRWPWIASGVAFAICLPNLLWQATHGWPFLGYAERIHETMMRWIPLTAYLLFQVVNIGVANFPLWLAGLLYLLFAPGMRPFRSLGFAFAAIILLLIVVGSKPYYPAPAYTILIAAGAALAERVFSQPGRRWLRPVSVVLLAAAGTAALPYSLPVLPVETFLAYSRVVHVEAAFTFETGRKIPLPQYFADMFGWENQVESVARVYSSLPAAERQKTSIEAGNYGEAGAINLFGPKKYGLPRAVSSHFSYRYWESTPADTKVVLAVGMNRKGLERRFGEVTLAEIITHPYAIFYENNIPIYICRNPH